MKKNIFKLFAILFVTTIGFISCTEEEIVKADYDYIQNPANVPANVVSVAVSDTSVVTASVSGTVPNDPNLLDWGVVYYTAISCFRRTRSSSVLIFCDQKQTEA